MTYTPITEWGGRLFQRQLVRALDDLEAGSYAAPQHFGAVGDGVTDDTAAVQAWATATAGAIGYLPAGNYRLTAPITCAQITIRGAGMTASNLIWDSGDGLDITATSWRATTIENVGLLTKAQGTGTALSIDYSAIISGGTIVPRAQKHCILENIRIAGATGAATDGWGSMTVVTSAIGVDVSGCRMIGYLSGSDGDTPDTVYGVWFGGSGSPVQLSLSQTHISLCQWAVKTEEAEGIFIGNGCEFVNCQFGYECENTVRESVVHIIGIHMNCLEKAIVLDDMAEVQIKDNSIYNYGDLATEFVAVEIGNNCKNAHASGNILRRLGSTTPYVAFDVTGGDGASIRHNMIDVGASTVGSIGIRIASAATDTDYRDNDFQTANVRVADSSTDAKTLKATSYVLRQSGVQVPLTGSTSETTLATVTVPGKSMGANGRLRVTLLFEHTNNGNNKTLRLKFGATTVVTKTVTTNVGHRIQIEIINRNSVSAQMTNNASTGGFGDAAFAHAGSSINTASDVTMLITGQLADGADSMSLESYLVEVMSQE